MGHMLMVHDGTSVCEGMHAQVEPNIHACHYVKIYNITHENMCAYLSTLQLVSYRQTLSAQYRSEGIDT